MFQVFPSVFERVLVRNPLSVHLQVDFAAFMDMVRTKGSKFRSLSRTHPGAQRRVPEYC